ncbi:hypothetical protein MGL_3547 [Paecilomyces variotii No. 5]|uniref:UBC core domain-containing protein n=1 Tax=Byssochlamys spectabilis (strain No. 5 / NBRC 109023) TaxID=1356009 RepID=V5FI59_BYSSN|nr:hypothetical protein MGL_3547 [Paecilomyces variotii No. 5]
METTGLTLNVVGLAGLVSTVIDLLNYVSDAGSRDEDYKTIKDLFELERGRFIQWVQVYNNHRRPKKEAKMIRALQKDPSVKTIFTRMERLIVDGASIMEQYGLIRPDASEDRRSKGGSRMLPILYGRLGRRINTLPHRIRWVVRDREKFRALINDMTLLNDRFGSLSRMRYKLEHRKPVHEEISSSSDQNISTSLSIVYEGSNVVDRFTQPCSIPEDTISPLEDMTGSSPYSIGDNTWTYMSIKEDLLGMSRFERSDHAETSHCPGSENYVEDIEEYSPQFAEASILSKGQQLVIGEINPRAYMRYGSLTSRIREEDTKHYEALPSNLRRYGKHIGLERRMRLELGYWLNYCSSNALAIDQRCTMAPIGDNIYEWRAVIEDPMNSPYEGGAFHVRFKIPRAYPMGAPKWKFETAIYHPNISRSSEEPVADLLCLPPDKGHWCADQTLMRWIDPIWELSKNPSSDPLHAAEKDILWQLRSNRINSENKAREWTKAYSTPYNHSDISETEHHVVNPSETVTNLDSFLAKATKTLSQLHDHLASTELSSHPESIPASYVSDILEEIWRIRNSRFIDVVGGEEFARFATTRWHSVLAKMEPIDASLAKIKDGTISPDVPTPQFFYELGRDIQKWRQETEDDLAAEAYGKCFSWRGAFRSAGFGYREQMRASADLPFRIFEQDPLSWL